ncbi:hypothetical protein ESCO_002313 [Escovopsis weberi]|uniref:Cell wall protein phiA n=1 Tax=Escovopsis weberi TaxID=150374 RepID=A0A0M8N8Z1_ESCWE|nr:hypothetical protein ESCO_002313 [Escovopsis weberi]
MKFSLSAVASVGAILIATAAAQITPPFYLQAFRAGIPFPRDRVSASFSNLWVDRFGSQNATCEGPDRGYANFYLEGERLHLLSPPGVTQLVFTDRSGFGRGQIGYLTNPTEIPPRFEVDGWHFDANRDLHFRGQNLIACEGGPSGGWNLRLDVGIIEPGCIGVRVHSTDEPVPIVCIYH